MELYQPLTSGTPERTYNGVVPKNTQKRVIIKEPGLADAYLQSQDGSKDFNWGYGGGGPSRLAEALASDAFDDATYGEIFGFCFRDALVKTLEKDKPFVLSRDRLIVEGLVHLTDLVNKSRLPAGKMLREDIQEFIAKHHQVRARMMSLLSQNALTNLVKSKFGIQQ